MRFIHLLSLGALVSVGHAQINFLTTKTITKPIYVTKTTSVSVISTVVSSTMSLTTIVRPVTATVLRAVTTTKVVTIMATQALPTTECSVITRPITATVLRAVTITHIQTITSLPTAVLEPVTSYITVLATAEAGAYMITSYITIFSFTASPGASLPTKVMSQTSNGTISTSFSPTATAAAYDTCGGTDYEAMACVNGFTCTPVSIYYSQCRPNDVVSTLISSVISSSSPTSETPSSTVTEPAATAAPYDGCGGLGYPILTCPVGYSCIANGIYYSQCLPDSESASPSSTSSMPPAATASDIPPTAFDPITKPLSYESVPAGSPYTITWEPSAPFGSISLYLLQGDNPSVLQYGPTIATGLDSNLGFYTWDVPASLTSYPVYGIILKLDSDPTILQYSNPFLISGLA